MRSALYYPHSSIGSENILKTALLLWDNIEYIAPWQGFRPEYATRAQAEAAEIIARERVPSVEEKKKAHEEIEEFATRTLPEAFMFQGVEQNGDYEIYPQKLLPETWHLLREMHIAGDPRQNLDIPFSAPTGLSLMSILADCCAGKTRARVTDRADAYAFVTNLLQGDSENKTEPVGQEANECFVAITLNVVDASTIDLSRLVELRKREQKSGGHAIRDLRHRYVDRMESYAKATTETVGTKSDAEELKRQLTDNMKDDLAALKDELKFARNDVLFSREMITAAVAAVGTIAALALGAAPVLEGVITATGAPITVGGLFATRNKFLSTRKSLLQKHPMAYLYELQNGKKSIAL